MGGVSCSKGLGFKSVYWMDIFPHLFVVKFVMFVGKDEKKQKRGPGWHNVFLKKESKRY